MIVGSISSARYVVESYDDDSFDNPFDSNKEIENEAFNLLDFAEEQPIWRLLMLGTYYYHEIIRKTIIGFGTLFNDIFIKHENIDNTTLDQTKVGLAYGLTQQKFFAKIREQANLTKAVAITLPRMSFEMTSIQYDATRKSGITQTFKASDGTNLKKVFMPVPYNIGFELSIFSKLNDDALQIIEQILPYFQPSFNITIELSEFNWRKKRCSIVLDNISFRDEYEGDFDNKNSINIHITIYCKDISIWSNRGYK